MNHSASPRSAIDDPSISLRLEMYRLASPLERRELRSALVTDYPELGEELNACCDGLDFLADWPQEWSSLVTHNADESVGALAVLGDFRIVRELGRGGMGIVYEAVQNSLGRRVALKVLPFVALLEPRRLQRFQQEAQATASLRHPNIVNVYCVGCDRGIHFYAMELIIGPTVAELIRQRSRQKRDRSGQSTSPSADGFEQIGAVSDAETRRTVPNQTATGLSTFNNAFFRQAAIVAAQVAEGLQFAHSIGVIHRDVKPSNLLIDGQGKPWIADFGLAHVQGDPSVTMTGDILGTLRYMSPEQVEGQFVDHRTDVYSLGATLYELVTCHPLIEGEDRQQILHQLQLGRPVAPRKHDSRIPHDLETIILKAISRAPDERYGSTGELALDLRRFADNRPIVARRANAIVQLQRLVRRNPGISALVGGVVMALSLLSTLTLVQSIRYARIARFESIAKSDADQSRRQADQLRNELQSLLTNTLTKTVETLENLPGVDDVQKKLLEDTVERYETLLKHVAEDDVQSRLEVAGAFNRLGRVVKFRFDELDGSRLYRRAIEVLTPLIEAYPEHLECRSELAWSLTMDGWNEWETEPIRKSAVILDELVLAAPDNHFYRFQRAANRGFLGYVLFVAGDLADAEKLLTQSERECREVSTKVPENHEYRANWQFFKGMLCEMHLRRHRFEIAERLLNETLAASQTVPDFTHDQARYQIAYGEYLISLGRLKRIQRDGDQAATVFVDVIERLTALASTFPRGTWPDQVVNRARLELMDTWLDMGRVEEANEVSSQVSDGLMNPPKEAGKEGVASRINRVLGRVAWLSGRTDDAERHYQLAIQYALLPKGRDILAELYLSCPVLACRNPSLALKLLREYPRTDDGEYLRWLGVAECANGEWEAARRSLEASLPLLDGGEAFDFLWLALANQHLGDTRASHQWLEKGLASQHRERTVSPEFFAETMKLASDVVR